MKNVVIATNALNILSNF